MRSLIDIRELNVDEIDELVRVANDIIDNPANLYRMSSNLDLKDLNNELKETQKELKSATANVSPLQQAFNKL